MAPELYVAVQALQLLWLIGVTCAMWLRKPGLDAGAAIDKFRTEFASTLEANRLALDSRMREQDIELTEIKTHMEHMPNSEELTHLEGTVKAIDARTASMGEGIQVMRRSVDRIENFLLRSDQRGGGGNG